jgi:hypothetical protein
VRQIVMVLIGSGQSAGLLADLAKTQLEARQYADAQSTVELSRQYARPGEQPAIRVLWNGFAARADRETVFHQ